LIKGYSDTHARGQSKFDRVLAAARRLRGRPDAAQWVRRLRQAALSEEEDTALAGALATIDTFV
jgi:indolepyruvate ferredoxin oxidoreductase, beta subunit